MIGIRKLQEWDQRLGTREGNLGVIMTTESSGLPGRIRNYFDLAVWQKSRRLVKSVYDVSRQFPREEMYGLASQMRRAAISIPSNIAEGYGRGTRKDYTHFLYNARGSLYELQTQLLLSQDLGFLSEQTMQPLMSEFSECFRLLSGLIKSLTQ